MPTAEVVKQVILLALNSLVSLAIKADQLSGAF